MNERQFRDPIAQIWGGTALVVCPRCEGPARAEGGAVRCGNCGFARLANEPSYAAGSAALVHNAWTPRCSICGGDLPKVARAKAQAHRSSVSVRCKSCGHSGHYPVYPRLPARSLDHDPASGLPYFLSISVGPHLLWVRNLDHLDLIEAYVGAKLRERTLRQARMTTLARLPAWIKSAANRDDLLKAIRHLRAKVANTGSA